MNTREFLRSKKIYVGANIADENAPENYFRLEDLLSEYAECEVKKISSNPVLCDENCDPFFIKTDIHGYCKKCGKNLGYVRK